ncbi:hypothetical protein Anapl_07252 [Anas platyrhynchos]|uniref:Uncharacterized protein n=1 Tax=Anas platyrhynchos TaxID=8839 RepID=R0L907_ANAPL|nr:hypothetical protein Anapl_07252 [Anas platyrhynchos]
MPIKSIRYLKLFVAGEPAMREALKYFKLLRFTLVYQSSASYPVTQLLCTLPFSVDDFVAAVNSLFIGYPSPLAAVRDDLGELELLAGPDWLFCLLGNNSRNVSASSPVCYSHPCTLISQITCHPETMSICLDEVVALQSENYIVLLHKSAIRKLANELFNPREGCEGEEGRSPWFTLPFQQHPFVQRSECSAVLDELAMHREKRGKKPGLCPRLLFPLIEEKGEVSFHSIRIYRLSQRTQKDPADNGFLHYPLPKDTCSGDEDGRVAAAVQHACELFDFYQNWLEAAEQLLLKLSLLFSGTDTSVKNVRWFRIST